MHAVLLIEEDTLIRELMREHLERTGYAACAVATVRAALEAAKWTEFSLVLLDFNSASDCSSQQLTDLRGLGAPVVMMHSRAAGTVIASDGDIEQVVWSPFDLSTLTSAVQRFVPIAATPTKPDAEGPAVKQSGTYVAQRAADSRPIGQITTLPAPLDPTVITGDGSLQVLGEIVLDATGGRRAGRF